MKKIKSKRSKKGEVIEYVVDTPKKITKNKNEPKLKDNSTVSLDDDIQVETLSNSDRVIGDVALSSSSLCKNIDSKTEENDSSSQDLFKSNSFITKNRGELAEDPISINSAVENVKVKRSSSIKNFLSRRPLSEVFEKLDKNDESHNDKSKPHRSSSLKKRLSFGKRRRSSKLSDSNAQERISKSQDILSSSQIMVSNSEMDDWRMDGLLLNTVEKSHSVQSLSLPSPHQNVQEEKKSNPQVVLIEEAGKNNETTTCKLNEEICIEENFQENESYKLFIKLEDSLVVTIQNLNIVVNEKHIDMPNSVPCDDWLILEICV